MGEAKRRGSFEERKAQAIGERIAREERRAEHRARMAAEQRERAAERDRLLGRQERKEAVLVAGGGHDHRMLLAALMGVSAPVLLLDDSLSGDEHT